MDDSDLTNVSQRRRQAADVCYPATKPMDWRITIQVFDAQGGIMGWAVRRVLDDWEAMSRQRRVLSRKAS